MSLPQQHSKASYAPQIAYAAGPAAAPTVSTGSHTARAPAVALAAKPSSNGAATSRAGPTQFHKPRLPLLLPASLRGQPAFPPAVAPYTVAHTASAASFAPASPAAVAAVDPLRNTAVSYGTNSSHRHSSSNSILHANSGMHPRRGSPQAHAAARGGSRDRRKHGGVLLSPVQVAVARRVPAASNGFGASGGFTGEEEKSSFPPLGATAAIPAASRRASDASRQALVEFLSSPSACRLFHATAEIRTVGSTLDRMIALGAGLDEAAVFSSSPNVSPGKQKHHQSHPAPPQAQPSEAQCLASLLRALRRMGEDGARFSSIADLLDALEATADLSRALQQLYPSDPPRRLVFRRVFEYLSSGDCEIFSEAAEQVLPETAAIEALIEAGGGAGDPKRAGPSLCENQDADGSGTLEILMAIDVEQHRRCADFPELIAAVTEERQRRTDKRKQERLARERHQTQAKEAIVNYFASKSAGSEDDLIAAASSLASGDSSSAVFFPNAARKPSWSKSQVDALVRAGGGSVEQTLCILDLIESGGRAQQQREKIEAVTDSTTAAAPAAAPTQPAAASSMPACPLCITDVVSLTALVSQTNQALEALKAQTHQWLNSKRCTLFAEEASSAASSPARKSIATILAAERLRIEQIAENRLRANRGQEPLPVDAEPSEEHVSQHSEFDETEFDLPSLEGDGIEAAAKPSKPQQLPLSSSASPDFAFTPAMVSHLFLVSRAGFATLAVLQSLQQASARFRSLRALATAVSRRHLETVKEREVTTARSMLRAYLESPRCKLFSLAFTQQAGATEPTISDAAAAPASSSSAAVAFSVQTLTSSELDALVAAAGGQVTTALLWLRHFDLYAHRYSTWDSLVAAMERACSSKQAREVAAAQLLTFLTHPSCPLFRVKEERRPGSGPAHTQVLDVESGRERCIPASATGLPTGISFTSAVLRASLLADGHAPIVAPAPPSRKAPAAVTFGQRAYTPIVASREDGSPLPPPPRSASRIASAPPAVYTVTNLSLRDMHRLFECSSAGPETLWHLQQLCWADPDRQALKDLDELIALVRCNHSALLRRLDSDLPLLRSFVLRCSPLASFFETAPIQINDAWFVRVMMACGGSAAGAITVLSRVCMEEGTLESWVDSKGQNNSGSPNKKAGARQTFAPSSATTSHTAAVTHMPPCLRFEDPASVSRTDTLLLLLELLQKSRAPSQLGLLSASATSSAAPAPPLWMLVEIQNALNLNSGLIWKRRLSTQQTMMQAAAAPRSNASTAALPVVPQMDPESSLDLQSDAPYVDLQMVGQLWNECAGFGAQLIPHLLFFSASVAQAQAAETRSKEAQDNADTNAAPCQPVESLSELVDALRQVHRHVTTSSASASAAAAELSSSHVEILLTHLYSPLSHLLPRPVVRESQSSASLERRARLWNANTTFYTSNQLLSPLSATEIKALVRKACSNGNKEDPASALTLLIDMDIALREQTLQSEPASGPVEAPFKNFPAFLSAVEKLAAKRLEDKQTLLTKLNATDPRTGRALFFPDARPAVSLSLADLAPLFSGGSGAAGFEGLAPPHDLVLQCFERLLSPVSLVAPGFASWAALVSAFRTNLVSAMQAIKQDLSLIETVLLASGVHLIAPEAIEPPSESTAREAVRAASSAMQRRVARSTGGIGGANDSDDLRCVPTFTHIYCPTASRWTELELIAFLEQAGGACLAVYWIMRLAEMRNAWKPAIDTVAAASPVPKSEQGSDAIANAAAVSPPLPPGFLAPNPFVFPTLQALGRAISHLRFHDERARKAELAAFLSSAHCTSLAPPLASEAAVTEAVDQLYASVPIDAASAPLGAPGDVLFHLWCFESARLSFASPRELLEHLSTHLRELSLLTEQGKRDHMTLVALLGQPSCPLLKRNQDTADRVSPPISSCFSGVHASASELNSIIAAGGRSVIQTVSALLELSTTLSPQGMPLQFSCVPQFVEALETAQAKRAEMEQAVLQYLSSSSAHSPANGGSIVPRPPSRSAAAASGGRTGAHLTVHTNASHTASSSAAGSKLILFAHAPVPVSWHAVSVRQLFLRSGLTTDVALLGALQTLNESLQHDSISRGSSLSGPCHLTSVLKRECEFLRWRQQHWTRDLTTGGSNTQQARDMAHIINGQFLGISSNNGSHDKLSSAVMPDRFSPTGRGGLSLVLRVPVPLAMVAAQLSGADGGAARKSKSAQKAVRKSAGAAGSSTADYPDDSFDSPSSAASPSTGTPRRLPRRAAVPESHFLPGSRRLGVSTFERDWEHELDSASVGDSGGMSASEKMKRIEKEIEAEEAEEARLALEAKQAREAAAAAAASAAASAATNSTMLESVEEAPASAPTPLVALPAASATAAAASSETQWVYLDDQQLEQGPYSTAQMTAWIAEGAFPPSLLVMTRLERSRLAEGASKWGPIHARTELCPPPPSLPSLTMSTASSDAPLVAEIAASPRGRTTPRHLPSTAAQHVHASSRNVHPPSTLPASFAAPPSSSSSSVDASSSASASSPLAPSTAPVRASTPLVVGGIVSSSLYEATAEIDRLESEYGSGDSKFKDSILINFRPPATITTVLDKSAQSHSHSKESKESKAEAAAGSTPLSAPASASATTTPLTLQPSLGGPVVPAPLSSTPRSLVLGARTASTARLQLEDDADAFLSPEEIAEREAAENKKQEDLYAVDEFASEPTIDAEKAAAVSLTSAASAALALSTLPAAAPAKLSAERSFFSSDPLETEVGPSSLHDQAPLKDELDLDIDDHDLPSLDNIDDAELGL